MDFRSLIEHSLSLCTFYTSLGENRETWLLRLPYSLALFHPSSLQKVILRLGRRESSVERSEAPSRGLFLIGISYFKINNLPLPAMILHEPFSDYFAHFLAGEVLFHQQPCSCADAFLLILP